MRGQAIPFYLDFSKCSNAEQAKIILETVRAIKRQLQENNPHIKVGITYSANENQTLKIAETYEDPRLFRTGTTGANQAEVMAEVEKLLDTDAYADCRDVFRIIPITTIPNIPDYHHHSERILKDIQNANEFLSVGNVILLWVNQNGLRDGTSGLLSGMHLDPGAVASYAIGGGITSLHEDFSGFIQRKLEDAVTAFCPISATLSELDKRVVLPLSVIPYLKSLYKKHGGSDSRAAVIFQDPINLNAVLEKLHEGKAAHTGLFGTGFGRTVGASEKTLAEFKASPFAERFARATVEPSMELKPK